jgi:hypothetical protein
MIVGTAGSLGAVIQLSRVPWLTRLLLGNVDPTVSDFQGRTNPGLFVMCFSSCVSPTLCGL